ncbi:lipoprotein [Alteromonas sp. 5E99-2]|nr:lipoprotein [Alteromonas sp. 5E99-2]MBO1255877.1 lipoprotein [Alteromonas sp. 5E99-2]
MGRASVILLAVLALSSCGYRGPLELPQEPEQSTPDTVEPAAQTSENQQ